MSPVAPDKISAATDAPDWLKSVQFPVLSLDHHTLKAKPDSRILLKLNEDPLLVTGKFGQGNVIAYTGFPPAFGSKDTLLLDRVLQTSTEYYLFAQISATILALASKEEPPVSIADLLNARSTPLFETLKNASGSDFPDVTLKWERTDSKNPRAKIHIKNGKNYLRQFRLRFDGPDFASGKAIPIWSNQYFDLLPGEEADCNVEIRKADRNSLGQVVMIGEILQKSDLKKYPVALLP